MINKKASLLLICVMAIAVGFSQNQPSAPSPEQQEEMKKKAEEIMKQENAKRQQQSGGMKTPPAPNKPSPEKEAEFKKQAEQMMREENAKRSTGTAPKPSSPTVNTSSDRLTPETLWSLGRMGKYVVSPDGLKIVYEITWPDIKENTLNKDLYVISSKGGAPIQITQTPTSESNPAWSKDGSKIYFLAPNDKSEDQLWVMNADGSNKKQISNIVNGISDFQFAASQLWVVFKQDVKLGQDLHLRYPDLPKANARIIDDLMYRHWDSWDDYLYTHLVFSKIENDELKETLTDINKGEQFDALDFSISPDEQFIAFSLKKMKGKQDALNTNTDVFVYDKATGKTENICMGMLGYDNNPKFSPDGKSIAWLSMEEPGYESDKNRIFVYNFTTKTKTDVTSDFTETVEDFTWSVDGNSIYFIGGKQATFPVFSLDVKTKAVKQITTGDFDYTSITTLKDQLIGTKMSMSAPTEMYKIDLKTVKEEQLTFTNKAILDKLKFGRVDKMWVKTLDKKSMLSWIIYPPDFDPAKKYPTLLYCQGGPQSAVSQFFSYRWNFQIMAANGYIVVAPNRRGLPTFGEEWNDQIAGEWGGLAMQDYLSAIDTAAKFPYVDANRLGAVGASFGGYSVYWLAGNHHKRFKTFVAHCGVFNLESWYGTTEEMFFANHDLKGAYWNTPKPKSYDKFSPSNFVGQWDTPLLVIHGEKDFRVPVSEGMQAFQAAQLKNIPSRFLYYPEAGHWVSKPQDGILWQRVYFEWLDRYLKNDLSGQR